MRTKPAIAKACRFIADQVLPALESPEKRLPSLRVLATRAGVSYRSMWQAMSDLRERGAVLHGPDGGSYLARAGTLGSLIPAAIDKPLSARIEERILADIHSGQLPAEARIPSYKDLQNRYGGHYLTIRSAVRVLAEKGYLREHGNTFAICGRKASPPSLSLYVVFPRRAEDPFVWLDFGITLDAVRGVESAGAARNLQVRFVTYDPADRRLHNAQRVPRPACEIDPVSCLGTIFVNDNLNVNPVEALHDLLTHRLPVAVIDCTGHLANAIPAGVSSRILCTTSIVDTRPGIDCGRYLRSLGHRRVAFFSINASQSWSRWRSEGLAMTLAGEGSPDPVPLFCCDTTAADFASLVKQAFGDYHRYLPQAYHADADIELPDTFARIGDAASNRTVVEPLFREAIKQKDITAWVTASDYITGFALDFLRRNRITVPQRMSVMGFDDSFSSIRHNITSYNYRIQDLIAIIVGLMLDTTLSLKRKQAVLERAGGRIVERGTTGPATGTSRGK